MLEVKIGAHLLQALIPLLYVFEKPDVRCPHAAVFGFPVVVGGIGHPILTANLVGVAAALDVAGIFTICECVKRFLLLVVLLYIASMQESSSCLSD